VARCNNRRGNQERGFALLLIFLMASVLAIMLYMELPRTAMQAQRDKEEKLIDRGEQYKRAIQLFVKKTMRYPAEIKDLENFQNQRFLRQRYADPMTGKDEWRLIHVQNGMLTDSKVTKPNGLAGQDQAKTPNGFVGEQIGLGGAPNQGQASGAANVRDRRRPSEGANSTMPGNTPGPAGGDPSGQNPPSGQPSDGSGTSPTGPTGPGIPGQPPYPGMPGIPSNPNTATPPGTSSGSSNTSAGGGSGGMVGSSGPFVGGGSTDANSGQTLPTGGSGQTYPAQPGSNGMPQGLGQQGTTTGGQSNAAADMIRNILTTPRPGGMPAGNVGGQTFGGGIAGVASKAEGEGVKVYNDRTLYQEWEFVFDPAKQKQIPNPNSLGTIGTPAGNMGSQPSPQQGAPGMSGTTSRPFGQ